MRPAHRALLLAGSLCAVLAWAGSRAAESVAGTTPLPGQACTAAGVALSDAIGCRASVRVDGGGTLNGGTLSLYYCDNVLGWTRSSNLFDYSLQANQLVDGGAPSVQVAPDIEPLARFGRVAVAAINLLGADGGSPNGFFADAGQNLRPVQRIECWGPEIP